ncbi:MAG: hypothetical protein ACR2KJ_13135, partial [Jatrophihabitans sp.]
MAADAGGIEVTHPDYAVAAKPIKAVQRRVIHVPTITGGQIRLWSDGAAVDTHSNKDDQGGWPVLTGQPPLPSKKLV